MIALASEGALLVGIDDRQGINAGNRGAFFTTAVAIVVKLREGRDRGAIQADRLQPSPCYGRHRSSILEDAKRQLEEQR